jgi:hypothetical protein
MQSKNNCDAETGAKSLRRRTSINVLKGFHLIACKKEMSAIASSLFGEMGGCRETTLLTPVKLAHPYATAHDSLRILAILLTAMRRCGMVKCIATRIVSMTSTSKSQHAHANAY